ncbi:MAG: PH domain-containing protein [Oscillospiraceae bacterium]|nr:PH domain-containing protein [Oscillospiraceae bacterium]
MEPMKNQLWTDKPHNFLGLALNFTRYIITTEKFITRKGFLNIHEDEIMLYRVTDKKLSLPLSQRIFGCGTITLHAKDSDTPTKELRSIKGPRAVMELLDEAVQQARQINLVQGRDMVGALNQDPCEDDGENCQFE